MSALSLATLGVQCQTPAVSMATLGVFCFEDARIGGGTKRSRRQVPGITGNRSIALREDEEVLAMLEAYFGARKH